MRHTRWAAPLSTFIGLIGAWELGVRLFDPPRYILPPPTDVWTAFGEVSATLPSHAMTTGVEALCGLIIGALAGAAVAGLMWTWSFARRTFLPLLVVSQTIPLVVVIPLLVLWFGLGLLPKVIIVVIVTFFPVAVATSQALANTDQVLLDTLRSMGAKRRHIARMVLIPSAMPQFFAGLRISTTYAVTYAVISEWLGASSGLGLLITRAQASFRVDRVLVAVVVISAMSIALVVLVNAIAQVVMPWRRALERSEATAKGYS